MSCVIKDFKKGKNNDQPTDANFSLREVIVSF